MMTTPLESDWRRFRKLREVALERFSKRSLSEVSAICSDSSLSHHERYVKISRLLARSEKQMAQAFDDPKRSQLLFQLGLINSFGLLEEGELEAFSQDLRGQVETLLSGLQ